MLIRVDLPAPFSPTMPWIDPRSTRSETWRLAWTVPKRLSIPTSSTAAGGSPAPGSLTGRAPPRGCSVRAALVGHVVDHLDLARDDVLLRLVDALLHLRRDHRLVVVVERPADAVLRQPEDQRAGLPVPFAGGLERLVGRQVDTLQHRGQHGVGMQVVLVAVDADRQLLGILGGLVDAEPGAAGGGID